MSSPSDVDLPRALLLLLSALDHVGLVVVVVVLVVVVVVGLGLGAAVVHDAAVDGHEQEEDEEADHARDERHRLDPHRVAQVPRVHRQVV